MHQHLVWQALFVRYMKLHLNTDGKCILDRTKLYKEN
jgi:hypothetical protein